MFLSCSNPRSTLNKTPRPNSPHPHKTMTRHHRLLLNSAVSLSPANGTRTSHRETMTRRLRLLDSSVSLSPAANGTRTTSVTYGGDAKFESIMVIILAVLLFALLCALGLNSIVRFALRCAGTHGTSAVAVTVRTASGGPVKEAVGRIPVVAYEAGVDVPAADCPICLGEFVEGEGVRVLPSCGHGFHAKCIDRWLVLQSSCPTCRQPVIEHCRKGDKEHVRVQIR